MSEVMREIPQYQCHKKVWALKIDSAAPNTKTSVGGCYLHFKEEFAPIFVTHEWLNKHNPRIGGYYVVFEDGYKSFIPSETFESIYSRC